MHLLSTLLTEQGYKVQGVSSGSTALTVVDSVLPDLILLDISMLDLNKVVQNLDKMLQRLIDKNIALMTMLEPGPKRIKADAGQIEPVIINLVVNTRDAMPREGKLTIEVTSVELGENEAQLSLEKSGEPGEAKSLSH